MGGGAKFDDHSNEGKRLGWVHFTQFGPVGISFSSLLFISPRLCKQDTTIHLAERLIIVWPNDIFEIL